MKEMILCSNKRIKYCEYFCQYFNTPKDLAYKMSQFPKIKGRQEKRVKRKTKYANQKTDQGVFVIKVTTVY